MRYLLLLVSLICLGSANGQEDDVFEFDDAIDPRELGTHLKANGKHIYGGEFRFYDVGAGSIINYQNRSEFTGEDPEFITFGYHKYWKDRQLNHRLTLFQNDIGTPRYRWKTEFSNYAVRKSSSYEDGLAVYRNRVSVVIDESFGEGAEYEITIGSFAQLPTVPGFEYPLQGGISASYRRAQSDDVYRILWNSNMGLWQSPKGNLMINGGFWVGYEKSNLGSRFVPVRGKIDLDYRISSRANLKAFYAPAYRSNGGHFESETNHEFGLMLNYMFNVKHRRGSIW